MDKRDLEEHLRNVLGREVAAIRHRGGAYGAYVGEGKMGSRMGSKRGSRRGTKRGSKKGSALIGLPYRAIGAAFVGEGRKRGSKRGSRRVGSRRVKFGSAFAGEGKKRRAVAKRRNKPRGNATALNAINKLVAEYRNQGYDFRTAQKMASQDYREMKGHGLRKRGSRRVAHRRPRY